MKTSSLLILLIVGLGAVFISAGIYAGTSVPDMIKMENKAYSKHEKNIVTFSHKKHSENYAKNSPELYKLGCGECHHDENNKPLSNLKIDDPVQSCIACHKKPGERPKGKGAPKLKKKERLAYHAEAIHYNCKGCHKKYNKKNKLKSKDKGAAPTTCNKCHAKS
jgi:cytochrome c553